MTENVVKVIIRERPTTDDVVIRHCDSVKNRIFVDDRPFTIGQVFDSKANQEDVYASIQPLVKKFLEGYCCNVMAYGQSGTGKSFTMGLQSDNFENSSRGLVPRVLQEIMQFAQSPDNETVIEISFFEIYNEKVFDLLSEKTDRQINAKGVGKFLCGTKRWVTNLLDAELILMEGNKNRRTRPTPMNTNSSRSHGIVVIYKKTKNSASSFHMVDLAGSEGVRRTGHKGEALAEGSHINRGLLGIGNIFKALSDGSCRVPYRDTVLGSVLQDSLNVNGFSTLVICISALKKDVSETINSLTFAQKAMNFKNNPKLVTVLHPDIKMKPTPKKDESMSSVNQENLDTPMPMRRPIATSTATKNRPNLNKITEMPTTVALTNRSNNLSILDLQHSQLMDSPTVKQCFEAMKRTLHKRNMRINSINFSPFDETTTSESDSGELNSTVIQNKQSEVQINTNEVPVPLTNPPSEYMTKEECLRLVESRLADLTRVTQQTVNNDLAVPIHTYHKDDFAVVGIDEISNVETNSPLPLPEDDKHLHSNNGLVNDSTILFEFKVPQALPPVNTTTTANRRRSVRIQQNAEKRKSIAPSKLPSPPPPPKQRRTTISKKQSRQSTIGHTVSKADHCKYVLNLLNKGDLKAIQVLSQVGMKTAYCIITHRSLNGNFKNFKEVSQAPFWRGKGWERFEKKLAADLCQVLNIPLNYCQAAISELQSNAIEKLRARAEFSETGLATIKVRAPNQVGGTRLITINVKLTEIGKTLHELVAKELGTCPLRVKLISAGKVINGHQILSEQNLQNNQQIMAVIVESNDNLAENAAYDRVQKAREDAQLLINQKRHEFMQMEDQKGNAIHLPPEEKNSLMIALAMHEKGKVELKKENYTEALLLLLDADNEFSRCNSKLLENVDNYALLNLDIAWCYLCLKSVMQLPDAEKRLKICESNFKKSYGENLDRVMILKGCTGNEKALIMRLHLLQAIVLFHQNRRLEAQNILLLTEAELNHLKISDESVMSLVAMGYTTSEARVGLRACGGDIDRSISYIIDLRSSREEARRRSRKERSVVKEAGKSKDKTWVNPRSLTDLVDMGFQSELCVVALQLSKNNVADALNMLQCNKTELQPKVAEDFLPDTKIVDQMTKMGFHPEIINMSLRQACNNMDEAVDMLLRMQGEGTYENLLTSICGSSSEATTSAATTLLSSVAAQFVENIQNAESKVDEDAMAAFERFSEGVSANGDDYLDNSLVMEENFIAEYKRFLSM